MTRVVSLIASATEIVCLVGGEKNLVGRSHECDYPPFVLSLPVCTSPKFDVHGSSYQIDQRVKALVQEGLSVYRVDGDKLRELKPDVIVTQSQCEVCAVSERDVEEAVAKWVGKKPRVVSLKPDQLRDVWKDIRAVGEALDNADIADVQIGWMKQQMNDVESKCRELSPKPTVACVEWIEPLMASGNWMPELVEKAGGVNLFGEVGKHAPWLTWDALVAADPDVILVLPCGYDIAKTREEMPALTNKPEWPRLRAVREGKVFLLDGNQYFNRPGPRLVQSLQILVEILHPGRFAFGFEGPGWQRF